MTILETLSTLIELRKFEIGKIRIYFIILTIEKIIRKNVK